MSLLQLIINDARAVSSFLEQQAEAGVCSAYVLDQQTRGLERRLRYLGRLKSLDEASQLMAAINAAPFLPEQRAALARVVLELCSAVDGEGSCSPRGSRPTQKLLKFEKALSRDDVQELEQIGMSRQAKIDLVAKRGWLLGLINPSEPTLFRMAAIVCWFDAAGSAEERKQIFVDMKAAVKEFSAKESPCQYIENYPDNMTHIPKNIHDICYGIDAPLNAEITELDSAMHGIKMRVHGAHQTGHMLPASPSTTDRSRSPVPLPPYSSTSLAVGTSFSRSSSGQLAPSGAPTQPSTAPIQPTTGLAWVFKPHLRVSPPPPPPEDAPPPPEDVSEYVDGLLKARELNKATKSAEKALTAMQVTPMRKPAAACENVIVTPMKKPVAAGDAARTTAGPKSRVKPDIEKPATVPDMPVAHKPVDHGNGKIIFDANRGSFRAICLRGKWNTERSFSVKTFSSMEQAFFHAVRAVDEFGAMHSAA